MEREWRTEDLGWIGSSQPFYCSTEGQRLVTAVLMPGAGPDSPHRTLLLPEGGSARQSSRREDLGMGNLGVKVNYPRRQLASESDLVTSEAYMTLVGTSKNGTGESHTKLTHQITLGKALALVSSSVRCR